MTGPSTSVMELLTRLETLLRGAEERAGPRSPKTEEALGLVRMIRGALPVELNEVDRLRAEAERIHRQAEDEARRIVLEAQTTARRRTDVVASHAPTGGQDRLADANRKAKEIRDGADAYAAQVLGELEDRILRVLEAIRKGKQLLKDVSR
jgi:vacuolar-type H+-ATPase subunit H